MKRTLADLYDISSVERWRIINRTVLITFCVAVVLLAVDFSPELTAVVASIVAMATYLVQFLTFAHDLARLKTAISKKRVYTGLLSIAFAFICLVGLRVCAKSSASVDEAVINWRISRINENLLGGDSGDGAPLSLLAAKLSVARQHNVKFEPAVMQQIKSSLADATAANIAGSLPVAGAFIDYSLPIKQSHKGNCLDTSPEHLTWKAITLTSRNVIPPPDQIKFENCTLDLDDSTFAQRFQPKTQTNAVSVVCVRCEIVYAGGQLPIAQVKGFVNLLFENCSFNVGFSNSSPEVARGLVADILKSENLAHIHYIAAGKDIWSGGRAIPERID